MFYGTEKLYPWITPPRSLYGIGEPIRIVQVICADFGDEVVILELAGGTGAQFVIV
jgi:hypothetical protein